MRDVTLKSLDEGKNKDQCPACAGCRGKSEWCRRTEHPQKCESSLKPSPFCFTLGICTTCDPLDRSVFVGKYYSADMTPLRKKRPINLNLLTIRLPVAGVMSIAHRAAGLLMFALTPVLVYWFDLSLRGPEGFRQAMALSSLWERWLWIAGIWAMAHHFLAGIRYLLLDLDIGFEKPVYRWTALAVLSGGALMALAAAVWVMR
ncbi:succinate dehydrogenase / fumarate reductase, cytochrome b subunit [Gammaproteobacteria bacterium]